MSTKNCNDKKQNSANEHSHVDHRKRLRAKFAESPEILENHELLELLLFYAIPRQNTNEQGHALLKRFKDIQGVFDAELPALAQVKGIGESTAFYLRVISEVLRRYEYVKADKNIAVNNTDTDIEEFIKNLFVGTSNEMLYLILFNANFEMIDCHKISEGYARSTTVDLREIMSYTLNSNAVAAILAHNHPGGRAVPSSEDYSVTSKIFNFMNAIGVDFIDHYIVSGEQCKAIFGNKRSRICSYVDDVEEEESKPFDYDFND